jgi:hypothetical protein
MEFNLTFNEAMEHLFKYKNKGWVQGENFSKNSYLSCKDGVIKVNTIDKDFSWSKNTNNVLLTKGLMDQKYRVIEVLNYNNVIGLR